jgi:hypothetical protein
MRNQLFSEYAQLEVDQSGSEGVGLFSANFFSDFQISNFKLGNQIFDPSKCVMYLHSYIRKRLKVLI